MPGQSWPPEERHRLGPEPPGEPVALVEPGDEVLRQQLHVARALAQRRQLDGDRAQPVVQVLAEQPLADQRRQVPVRGREHAHVDADLRRAADVAEGRRVEDAEQLDLRGLAHLPDLVEEDRAAVRDLEEARLGPVGPGERAALVAEQLALQQLLLQGGALDDDEGPAPPGAARVEQLARPSPCPSRSRR